MEEKKYEAGKVEISSAEYRDLVTDAVEARHEASEQRSEKWKLESEKNKLAKELEEANKKIAELESIIGNLHQSGIAYGSTSAPNNAPWWSQVTCNNINNNKENN
jgi:seryl-tRNA synthetase